MAMGIAGVLVFGGSFIFPAAIAASVAVVVALLVLCTRVRWLTILVALQGAVAGIGLSQAEVVAYRLTHPDDVLLFLSTGLQLLGAATAAIAGIGASVHGLRRGRLPFSRTTPA
jgi:hypothetical protein